MKRPWQGFADASAASLATFAIGVYASRSLDPKQLGLFAVVFTAFVAATVIPTQLIFVPVEIQSVQFSSSDRIGVCKPAIRKALRPTFVSLLLIMTAVALAPRIGQRESLHLLWSAVVAAGLSPFQDHVRRVFHLSHQASTALAMSVTHLTTVLVLLAVSEIVGVPPSARPFLALALGNLFSLTFGAWRISVADPPMPPLAGPLNHGRWLLVAGLLAAGSSTVAAIIVTHLAGIEQLGYAEAARIIAQPVNVAGVGVAAALRPLSMEAGFIRNVVAAKLVRRRFRRFLVPVGIFWLVLSSGPFLSDVGQQLLPSAYQVRYLVPLSIFAALANALSFPRQFELMAAERSRQLATSETLGSAMRVVFAVTASISGANSVPMGSLALGGTRIAMYARASRSMYNPSLVDDPREPHAA